MSSESNSADVLSAWRDALDARKRKLPKSERAAIVHVMRQIAEAASDDAQRSAVPAHVAAVIAESSYLRRFLVRHPNAVVHLAEPGPARSRDEWLAALSPRVTATGDEDALVRILRIVRHEAMLSMTARELASGDALTTGADLAAFAEAVLQLALDQWTEWLKPRFGVPRLVDGTVCTPIVIGMGKLGGRELNYSSDIDLIFAYASDAGKTDGAGGLGRTVDLHTYFSRLFARVGQTLSAITAEGFVFRVDLDLRPEGRTGPICNSVEGLERYYESFGHPWERLAWIKARPVAGDFALGAELIAGLAPFVYRKSLDYTFADEVVAMKRRIDARGARLARQGGFNVKLGRGGIREVEFALQTLQLTWGGRLPEIRAVDTAGAAQRLALAGLIDAGEADRLLAAYRFLRRLEHALQLADDRQTHWLSGETSERKRVASVLGFSGPDLGVGDFEEALATHRREVREAFDPIAEGGKESDADGWGSAFNVVVDPDAEPEIRLAGLSELGFAAPQGTLRRVDALMRRPDSPFHPRAIAQGGALARALLTGVSASPDPDAALMHTESLLKTLRHRRGALDQLEQDPRRLRRLASLFGTSHLLSRLLVRSPGLLDCLVFDGSEPVVKTAPQLKAALAAEPHVDGDWEQLLGAVRRFHQAEVVRIGFFDLAGIIDTEAVSQQLSDLADTIIACLTRHAVADTREKTGVDCGDIGVIAVGALAGCELGYGSQLNLIFVHNAQTPLAVVTKLARTIVTGLSCATPEGTLYAFDTRARPSGNLGPLCVTAERLLHHHQGDDAAVWERQSILKTRAVVGAEPVERLVDAVRSEALGRLVDAPKITAKALDEIRQAQLSDTSGPAVVSRGRGGMMDLEFIVAFLQLAGAEASTLHDHAAAAPNSATALVGLAELGLVEDVRSLTEARAFIRQLENRLAIVQDRPIAGLADADRAESATPDDGPLSRLAVRMGYASGPGTNPGASLASEYRHARDTIYDCYKKTLQLHGDAT